MIKGIIHGVIVDEIFLIVFFSDQHEECYFVLRTITFIRTECD
jgi:hypothetical protein